MSKMGAVLVTVVVLCGCGSASWDWKNIDVYDVIVNGGDAVTLDSDYIQKLEISDEFQKTYLTKITATGVNDAVLHSSTYLEQISDNGSIYTTGSEIYQILSLPDEFDIYLEQGHGIDTESGSTDMEAIANIFGSEGDELFNLVSSCSDDEVDNLINDMLEDSFGLGMSIDELRNLQYNIQYNNPKSVSKDGVTCKWGEKRNQVITVV